MTPDDALRIVDLGCQPFLAVLHQQEACVAARAAGRVPDTVFLAEHPPVYTVGIGEALEAVRGLQDPAGEAIPVLRVRRGGGATFHGPGQLVIYPILDLRARRWSVREYLTRLSRALRVMLATYGLRAGERPEAPGLWIGERKIAAIGIAVRRGITLHGCALNVTTDVRYFAGCVPCRMPGLPVTSMARELERPVLWPSVIVRVTAALHGILDEASGIQTCDDILSGSVSAPWAERPLPVPAR